ncbi:MAG: DUF4342 domain-containing protein [Cellulosilyticum sp.]|nr:DUF4342 domain-containing protein [Cellulosilyticum sp.]
MGTITLEQVDLVMQRANVSFTEAKEALEQCGGDTVEALLLLEKSKKVNSDTTTSQGGFKNFLSKIHSTSFILRKDEQIFIDVPLTIAILALIFCCYLSITALIIAIILGIKVEIKGQNTVAEKLNSTIDLMKK